MVKRISIIMCMISSINLAADEHTPLFKPTLEIYPASNKIEIDGKIDKNEWIGSAVVTDFSEIDPGVNIKPLVETKVYVSYSKTHLLLGFIAYDDPGSVRASLQNRDEAFDDDFVGLFLDTWGDASVSYEIFSNPLGVQMDLQMQSGGQEDAGFDMDYISKGRITGEGFEVEMAIPFSSLSFPDIENQTWRASFIRSHPRDIRRIYTWTAIDRDNSCLMCQLGYLNGIKGIRPVKRLELLPAVVSSKYSKYDSDNNPINDPANTELSLGLRYDINPEIKFEITLNPDFSQVEADADQIDVNSEFALSYPEKRAFFNESSDLYNTWIDAVYTRSINNPIIAGRLSGRWKKVSFSYLTALDEDSPFIIPFEQQSGFANGGKSISNIFRIKNSFGEGSHYGFLLTDRRLNKGGTGTVGGLDGRIRLTKKYQLELQILFSHTEEPDDTTMITDENIKSLHFGDKNYTGEFDGESYNGNSIYASFERSAKVWGFDFNYNHTSPTFRADNGFIGRNDTRMISFSSNWNIIPEKSIVSNFFVGIGGGKRWKYDWDYRSHWIWSFIGIKLPYQIFIGLNLIRDNEIYHDTEFYDLRMVNVHASSQLNEKISTGFRFWKGENIFRSENPELGEGVSYGIWVDYKITSRIKFSQNFDHSDLNSIESGEEYYSGLISRTKINFQFSKALSLRFIIQNNSFSKTVDFQPLLSYQPSPFTIFYIGSAQDWDNKGSLFHLNENSRQLFMKFQYLFKTR